MSEQKTVLVTGASGFIAAHCVLQLLERGYHVRGTARSMTKANRVRDALAKHNPKAAEVEFFEADLGSDDGWAEAVAGCDGVLHVASPFPLQRPKDENEIIRPAVEGARRALRAASGAGVRRTVLTSSMAAIAYGDWQGKEKTFTEEDWTNTDSPTLEAYPKSKTLAERAAWDFIEESGTQMELAVVNPALVLGPMLGADFGTSVEVVRKLFLGEIPGCPRLGWPIVDVRDVALMHVQALETPEAAGHRFLCAGDFLWMKDIADILRPEFPDFAKKLPSAQLPDWLVKVIALFDADLKAVVGDVGRKPLWPSVKAERILGWQPRPVRESVLDTGRTLVEYGAVKA
jgi:dihydroflavonol-4-reductase